MLEKLNPFWWKDRMMAALVGIARAEIQKAINDTILEFSVETERLNFSLSSERNASWCKTRVRVMPDAMVKQLKEKRGA